MRREPMPQPVEPALSLLETEETLYYIKQRFHRLLMEALNLSPISCPLFVSRDSGMQDNLNGTERPVSFNISALGGRSFEVVHSLAKWKRYALGRLKIPEGKGICTDMNALRPDEDFLSSRIHSVHVDQWDWEKVIAPEQRGLYTLKETVKQIYGALRQCEQDICLRMGMEPVLPEEITFIHTGELAAKYPQLSPKERENAACWEFGAVFLIGIGGELADGTVHDGRAPDYDDWSTPTAGGLSGLNGDILVWNPALRQAFELSSMGIRVDPAALVRQLEIRGCPERLEMPWHRLLTTGKLPPSIGGGIGKSRLTMFMLRKTHIGEVQFNSWPKEFGPAGVHKGLNKENDKGDRGDDAGLTLY